MKVPLSWLKDHVDTTLSPEELARRLTFAGLEVEAMQFVGLPLPEGKQDAKISGLAWDRDKIVIGALTEVKPHPNADRLVLAQLDDGEQVHTVLTGAPNLFPYLDPTVGAGLSARPLKVAYAREGAQLYDGHLPGQQLMTLERTKIRGVDSYSMACSEKELGISEEHEGIIILDEDAPVGTPLADYMGDVVLDIAITPNHARNASILGIAREIAALTGQPLRKPDYSVQTEGADIRDQVSIEIREPDLNPRFTLALIKDVEIRQSPYWMQRRLRLAGMRPINNIVDSTNYVMAELGQPLHAFDYDVLVERALKEGGRRKEEEGRKDASPEEVVPTIITRLPEPGESLTTLDSVTRAMDDFTILVCDTAGALSLGGIMGGQESEVSESTTNVLLEGAAWEFINIRRTLQAQKISSEAGSRFSRGVHPAMTERSVRRAIELMRRWSGGVVARGLVDAYPKPAEPVSVILPLREVRRLLGISLRVEEVVGILSALEFTCEVEEDGGHVIRVTVPDHRLDIGEGVVGQADLIEEIARIYGYDRIPETQISDTIPPQRSNPGVELEERVRDILVDAGLQEVVTYRLTTPEREGRILPKDTRPDDRPYVTLANPIVSDRVSMRHTVLSGVLEILERNLRVRERIAVFEIGAVYFPGEEGALPDEPRRLALAMTGPREDPHWQGADRAPLDFFDLKGVVETLAAGLHLSGVRTEPAAHPSYHPGKCARLLLDGNQAGIFGELHPLVRENYQVPDQPVLAGEFDLELLIARVPERFEVSSPPLYPPVLEDLAVILDEAVPASEVAATIAQAGGAVVAGVRLFDVYRGEQIGAGKKSLAYSVTYQADRTLTDEEVAQVRGKIVRRLEQSLGARLRT